LIFGKNKIELNNPKHVSTEITTVATIFFTKKNYTPLFTK
jgi:hypothetical protein